MPRRKTGAHIPDARYLTESGAATLLPTAGGRVIADSHHILDGIDDAFRAWRADEPGEPMPATDVSILDVTENAKPDILFESLVRKPEHASGLALTQDQILGFLTGHPQRLCQPGSTNFLFESYGELFVARMQLRDSRSLPYAFAYRFDSIRPLFDKRNVLVVRSAGVTGRLLRFTPFVA